MAVFLGIDTSNYTTSLALYDNESKSDISVRKLLPVKEGELGIRQSDAVFHHNRQLPVLFREIMDKNNVAITAIGVSEKPRPIEGSYMPCFTVGTGYANVLGKALSVPVYTFTHQHGHIVSALYSVGRLDLMGKPFITFHISGGTTEALLVDKDFNITLVAKTLDLNAGQAVDRTGVMLGMKFPCGGELDSLSVKCDTKFNIRTSLKGLDCSLSGVENKVKAMIEKGCEKEDAAKFVMDYISKTVLDMTDRIIEEYGVMPVVFSGGVSGSEILRKTMKSKYSCYFPEKEYGCDNASGVAVFAKLKSELCKY